MLYYHCMLNSYNSGKGTMRKANSGNFFLALILNIVFNAEWAIPAIVLLILHFTIDLSILWFWLAVGIWVGGTLIVTLILSWAGRCAEPDKPQENKNPYSATNSSVFGQKKKD